MFIVIEGPNGVGKTTVCSALASALRDSGKSVHPTAEPTASALGKAIRELEAFMPPRALALSCAADRYDHIAREIQPQLASGSVVLSDRYVPSSLVFQRIDGLDIDWIWSVNSAAVAPDLTVYLELDPATLAARLDQRGRRSRFETQGLSALELNYYKEARGFLARKGWKQAALDCRSRTPIQIAGEISDLLP